MIRRPPRSTRTDTPFPATTLFRAPDILSRARRTGGRALFEEMPLSDLLVVVLLGIVEGLTEFLQVTSTGHLIFAGELRGFNGAVWSTFDSVIQLGANRDARARKSVGWGKRVAGRIEHGCRRNIKKKKT